MGRTVSQLIIHHTACGHGTVEAIRAEHKGRGWTDIGYHWIIGNGQGIPDGHIAAGRPEDLQGSGVKLNNRGKLQVVLIGNFEKGNPGYSGPPTKRQLSALGHWLLVNGKKYAVKGNYPAILGHKEAALPKFPTACPGNQLPLILIRLWYNRATQAEKAKKPFLSLDSFIEHHKQI